MKEQLIKELEKIGWKYMEEDTWYIDFIRDDSELIIELENKDITIKERENPFHDSHPRSLDYETIIVLSQFVKKL